MEVLDTSIANVSLRYIAGGLSAASADAEWVITSYLAANAVVLPLSGLVLHRPRSAELRPSQRCGVHCRIDGLRHGYEFFTEAIIFRCIQGMSGGGLQPSAQG